MRKDFLSKILPLSVIIINGHPASIIHIIIFTGTKEKVMHIKIKSPGDIAGALLLLCNFFVLVTCQDEVYMFCDIFDMVADTL